MSSEQSHLNFMHDCSKRCICIVQSFEDGNRQRLLSTERKQSDKSGQWSMFAQIHTYNTKDSIDFNEFSGDGRVELGVFLMHHSIGQRSLFNIHSELATIVSLFMHSYYSMIYLFRMKRCTSADCALCHILTQIHKHTPSCGA